MSNWTFQLAELVRMTNFQEHTNCLQNIISINLLLYLYLLQTFLIHISARKCGNDRVVQQHKEGLWDQERRSYMLKTLVSGRGKKQKDEVSSKTTGHYWLGWNIRCFNMASPWYLRRVFQTLMHNCKWTNICGYEVEWWKQLNSRLSPQVVLS